MSKVGNYDYYMKLGFMVNELNLKNTELEVYAIIYSFSKDGKHWFTGNQQYLCDWTNKGKSAIQNALNSLVEKELILKEEYYNNDVKYCEYCININKLDFNNPGYDEKEGTPVKTKVNNTLNNINNNINKNNIKIEKEAGGMKNSECLKIFLTKYEEIYGTKYTDIFPKMYANLDSINNALGEKDYKLLSEKLVEWMLFWSTSDWQKLEGNFTLGAVTQLWIRNKLDGKIPKNPPKASLHDESDLKGVIRRTPRRK